MESERQLLPVNREQIFTVASQLLQENNQPPSLAYVRSYFDTPQSPKIAVYFSEWRDENAETIASYRDTKEQWKKLAGIRQQQLTDVSTAFDELREECHSLKDFLATNHPQILKEWENQTLSIAL